MDKKKNSLRETNISNDWLFGKTMSDAELCRMLLEKVLGVKIKRVEFLNNQQVVDNLNAGKGIRLDIYVESDESVVYDVEIRSDEECEVEYMTYQDRLNEEREEGREECKIELVEEMVKKNLDTDLIMQITKLTEQQIKEIEKNIEISV